MYYSIGPIYMDRTKNGKNGGMPKNSVIRGLSPNV